MRPILTSVYARRSGQSDPLAALSDFFADGDVDMPDRGWLRRDDTTTPVGDGRWTNLVATLGTGYLGQIDAGGGTGSLHFNNNDGCSWVKQVDAALFGVETRVTVRNAANSGDPPLTNFRLAGLIAQDEYTTNVDEVALAYGSAGSAGTVGPRVYRHHTVNGSTGAGGGGVPGFAQTANLTGMSRYLRMLRDRANSDRWVLQYKTNLGDAWTTLHDAQRGASAMPNTVYVGLAVWSDQASHDISGAFDFVRFFTPIASDFP